MRNPKEKKGNAEKKNILEMLFLNAITFENSTTLLTILPLLADVSPQFSYSCISNVRARHVC